MAGRDRIIKQIRFINGSEVLASILSWEDGEFVEINNALEMEPLESDIDDSKTYYLLRPMVSYIDDLGKIIQVNPSSIMCMTDPSPTVLQQYEGSLRDILHQMDDGATRDSGSNIVSFDSRKRILTED